MITFQAERIADCLGEAMQHLNGHYKEASQHQDTIPLGPDFARYQMLDERQQLLTVTARDRGVLVGYSTWFIDFQIHYAATKWSESDIYWVHSDFRGQGIWKAMRSFARAELKARGVAIFRVRVPKRLLSSERATLETEGLVEGDTVFELAL